MNPNKLFIKDIAKVKHDKIVLDISIVEEESRDLPMVVFLLYRKVLGYKEVDLTENIQGIIIYLVLIIVSKQNVVKNMNAVSCKVFGEGGPKEHTIKVGKKSYLLLVTEILIRLFPMH